MENERILLRNTHTYTHKHTLQMRGKVPFIVPYIGFPWAWAWAWYTCLTKGLLNITNSILAYQDQGPLTILITQTTTHYNVTINENDHHFLI